MRFFKVVSIFVFAVGLLFLQACEEEGDPLILQDIYNANPNDRPRFKVFVNGVEFSAEEAQGAKVGNDIIITAGDKGAQMNINITDFIPGVYSGEGIDRVENQIRYTNASGGQFLSNRSGDNSDAKVIINFLDEDENKISGRFSARLYDSNFGEDIYLTNGVFNDLYINAPFFGRMTAVVDNQNFNSDECFYSSAKISQRVIDRITATSKDDSTRITFQIEEKVGLRTYTIGDTLASAVYISNTFSFDKQENEYVGENGTIVITSIDSVRNRLKGNFSFQGENQKGETISISNGNFNALFN